MKIAKNITGATSVCAIILGSAGAAYAEGELNIMTWEGYADDSFIAPFEAATGCK